MKEKVAKKLARAVYWRDHVAMLLNWRCHVASLPRCHAVVLA